MIFFPFLGNYHYPLCLASLHVEDLWYQVVFVMVDTPIKSKQTKQHAKLSLYGGVKCYISMTLQIEGVMKVIECKHMYCLILTNKRVTHLRFEVLPYPMQCSIRKRTLTNNYSMLAIFITLLLTWFLNMILLWGLFLHEWIHVFAGKKMGPWVKPWRMTSNKWNSFAWRLVMRIAAGDPKSLDNVKSAEYSTIYGMFDGFGSQPLTWDSILFPQLVSENVT